MIYILDTNIVSYIIKSQDMAVIDRFEETASQATVAVSSVSVAELYYGVKKKKSQRF